MGRSKKWKPEVQQMSEKIKFFTAKQTQKRRSKKDTISVFSRPQCITRTTGLVVMNKSIILTRIKSSQPLQTGLQKAKKNV